jgi:predicted O-methyltransferase YrrM
MIKNLTIRAANGASKPKLASEFLGLLALNSSPQTLLELGTHMGISSAHLSIVLDNENSKFKITTFDDSPYRQRIAKTIH